MKNLLIIASLLTSGVYAADIADEWRASGRLNAYIENIDVSGGSSTSDKEGTTHDEELSLRFAGPLQGGQAGVDIRARGTNDSRIQKDGFELLYLHAYFITKIWRLEVGDVAASYNPYVYGGSVKGIKAVYTSPKKDHTWNYSMIAGYKKSLWREVYTKDQYEVPTGYSGAFEAKYIHERSKEIAISAASYQDDLSTGDTNSTNLGKKGVSIGVDGRWRFNRYVTLKGQFAIVDATDDLSHGKPTSSSNALLLKVLTKPNLRSIRSNFTYTRVGTDFISLSGSAPQDTEQFENSNTWRINQKLSARLGLRARRDNLDGSLGGTQRVYYENLSFSYRPDFIKRSDINVRFSNRDTKGRGTDTGSQTAGIDMNVRRKDGWRYGVGYEYNKLTDHNSSLNTSTTNSIRTTIGYKKRIDKEKSYRVTVGLNYQRVKSSNVNNNYGIKLDMGYDYSRRLALDFYYLSRYAYQDISNDTQNSTYQFRVTYRLDPKGRQIIRLLLEQIHYDVEDDATNSYNQFRGKLSYSLNF
ncbi:hypothetical protein [Sulfurospirillum sp. 1612]|uniref:hypothetical protein n=1 Tax=Sulfurospirillum sp. 1612 TaxID=3094835 RepID=UPI002F927EA8